MMTVENNLRTCSSCGKELPTSEFYADKSKPSGYKSACKSCVRAKRNERTRIQKEGRIEKQVKSTGSNTKIECKTCHKMLEPVKFYKRNNKLIQTCISCRRKNRKNEYEPKKENAEVDVDNLEACLEAIVQITTGLKKCKKCQIWKEYPQFKKRDRSLSGRSSVCKSCSDTKSIEEMSESYRKARRSLDERNQKIIKLTLKHKGTIK